MQVFVSDRKKSPVFPTRRFRRVEDRLSPRTGVHEPLVILRD